MFFAFHALFAALIQSLNVGREKLEATNCTEPYLIADGPCSPQPPDTTLGSVNQTFGIVYTSDEDNWSCSYLPYRSVPISTP